MSNADHIGRETEAEALGQTWKFSRWDRGVWVAFANWAKNMLPNPVEQMLKHIDTAALKDAQVVRRQKQDDWQEQRRYDDAIKACRTDEERRAVPPPVLMLNSYSPMADMLAQRAQDKDNSYLSFNGPELNSLLNSPVGSGYLAYLLLRKNHPDISEDTAFDVSNVLGQTPSTMAGFTSELDRVLDIVAGRTPPAPKNE